MIVATAGHVDHGKTELIRALTGVDTDRLPEEKKRGLSIDLGFAYQALDDGPVLGFVDVPGHEKFIRNMLAGVGGIDMGLLVVAADDGVMPQTREHCAILDMLGITECVVAITKVDTVDQSRVPEVMHEVRELLSSTAMRDAAMYPVCAPRSQGIDALHEVLIGKANCLTTRPAEGAFRLAVDRCFSLKGIGLVVTGMVFAGSARIDQQLVLSPRGLPVRVRGIRSHDRVSDTASSGERCAINLTGRGLSEASVRRGDWLQDAFLHSPTNRIDVELGVLADAPRALKHWTPVHLHIGAAHHSARVAVLEGGAVASGSQALVQLVVDGDVCAVTGDRFVIRDQSARRTLGGGRVIDPDSPKRGRARPQRLALVRAMAKAEHAEAMTALSEVAPFGIECRQFQRARNVSDAHMRELLDRSGLVVIGKHDQARFLGQQQWAALGDSMLACVGEWHAQNTDSLGPNLNEVRFTMRPHAPALIVEELAAGLMSEARLQRRGVVVHLPEHKVTLTATDTALWQSLLGALSPEEGSPPSLQQAAEHIGADKKTVEQCLKRVARAGLVVQIARNRYIPVAVVQRLSEIAIAALDGDEQARFTAADYRDRSGLGRNFVIDLLEYFDRVGFTERLGDSRRLKNHQTWHAANGG